MEERRMSSTTLSRGTLWTVDTRVVAYAAIGAALYGVLGLVSSPLPGSGIALRPAFALVPFFGFSFGPIVGLVVGLAGNSILEQLGGAALGDYWLRSVETGIAGLVAGLAVLYLRGMTHGPLQRRAIGGAIAGVVATVVGLTFGFLQILTAQADAGAIFSNQYLPLVIGDGVASVLLVPILVYAWDPLSESMAS
jgi:energy-coupling factor transport system substrate-specific component